jgi:hypothetical protein
MNNRFYLSVLLTALIVVTPLAVAVAPVPEPGYLADERRRPAEFPAWPIWRRTRAVKEFFRGVEAFFADHFPGRNAFLAVAADLREAAGFVELDKCYRGRNNWLFLGDNYGLGVSKLRGSVFLSPDDLLRQRGRYEKMAETARAIGADFAIFIGPNKSSVYPEYLPPFIIPASERFITPLVASLQQAGLKIYDPTDRLKRLKSKGLLYYRTDTHWNALGAYEAFEGFRAYMGLPPLPPLTLTESPALWPGDLVAIGGYTQFPLTSGDNFELDWGESPPAWREEYGLYLNAQATSDKSVWLFGDSFSEALKPYLMATFREIKFFRNSDFEAILGEQKRGPDLIIFEIVERGFGD